MILPVTQLVVPNGAGNLQPGSIRIAWWYGTDVRFPFALVDSAAAPYPLIGGTALLLGFKKNESDPSPLIQFSPDVLTDGPNGKGYWTIPRTVRTVLGTGDIVFTVGFRDDNVGFEDDVLDMSRATIRARAEDFDDPTTVPPSGQPLALGPNFGHSDTFEDFPDPATKPWLAWVADDTQLAYYSDGIAWHELGSDGLPDPTSLADGTVMVVRSGIWVPGKLTPNDIAPAFSVSASFPGTGLVEVGTTVASVSVSASYPNGAATSATFTDGTHTNTLSSPFTASTLNNGGAGYMRTTPGQFNFSLAAHQGSNNANANDPLVFANRLYFDSAVPGTYNAAFIAALTGQAIASGRARTINFPDCGGTKKTYYAIPTSYGDPTSFTKDNFTFPMTKVATGISVTNGLGVAISYELWASVSILSGTQNGVVVN